MVEDLDKKIEEIHKEACSNCESTYIDPETGFNVFTEYFLLERGYCCENNCRHCPYNKNEK